jgi:hypothetical protein
LHGDENPKTIEFADHLARLLSAHARLPEAEAMWREELARLRAKDTKAGGPSASSIALLLHHWGEALARAKRLTEARALAEEAWQLYEQHAEWPEKERQHAFRVVLGTLIGIGDRAALQPLHPKILQTARATASTDDSLPTAALAELVLHQLAERQFAEAESNARELQRIRDKLWPDDWRTFNTRSMLGDSLLAQKKHAEAEPLLLSGYEGMQRRKESIPAAGKVRLKEALQRLVRFYEATGAAQSADEWKAKLASFNEDASPPPTSPKP